MVAHLSLRQQPHGLDNLADRLEVAVNSTECHIVATGLESHAQALEQRRLLLLNKFALCGLSPPLDRMMQGIRRNAEANESIQSPFTPLVCSIDRNRRGHRNYQRQQRRVKVPADEPSSTAHQRAGDGERGGALCDGREERDTREFTECHKLARVHGGHHVDK
jgi:hypothetical protein